METVIRRRLTRKIEGVNWNTEKAGGGWSVCLIDAATVPQEYWSKCQVHTVNVLVLWRLHRTLYVNFKFKLTSNNPARCWVRQMTLSWIASQYRRSEAGAQLLPRMTETLPGCTHSVFLLQYLSFFSHPSSCSSASLSTPSLPFPKSLPSLLQLLNL